MALKSPLMPSPTAISSAFSPYTDSPNSPASFANKFPRDTQSNRSSGPTDSLAPPPSPYPQQVDPSPVDSNGTESTDIDEDAQDDPDLKSPLPPADGEVKSLDIEINSPQSTKSDKPHRLNTQITPRSRSGSPDDEPPSVIHVPAGFKEFQGDFDSPQSATRPKSSLISPTTPEPALSPDAKRAATATSPLNTDVPRQMDRSTPRAQTRNDLEQEFKRKKRSSILEDIPESSGRDNAGEDTDEEQPDTAGLVGDGAMVQVQYALTNAEGEVKALRTALSECWTLCNTLASLSSNHRLRTFKFAGKQEQQEQAWQSCWRLCQKLYESRDEDHAPQVIPTLELCRDFCQSLFEARQRGHETSDSVLRVSFELNNHLYNTHDRTLPDAFNERTLDFYVTLCHRLMKQRTSLPHETDALLRACWSLAEMLFNLRQSTREGRSADEEQLGSAVQACWELCDLFREGWTQIRPDRGTPRPSQTTFPTHSSSASTRSTERSNSSLSNRQYVDASAAPIPETPTTIFDDATTAASSPDDSNVPNILVLGPANVTQVVGGATMRGGNPGGDTHLERWSSNASVLSGYSESASSQRSSSTATPGPDENHLVRLRYLLLKAAMNTGYSRSSGQQLPAYALGMAKTAFGGAPWQVKIFNYFQKLVTNDKSMINAHAFPSRRIAAADMAKSVKWLGRNEQWAWMRDMYRLVFGFGIDEAERRGGAIQV